MMAHTVATCSDGLTRYHRPELIISVGVLGQALQPDIHVRHIALLHHRVQSPLHSSKTFTFCSFPCEQSISSCCSSLEGMRHIAIVSSSFHTRCSRSVLPDVICATWDFGAGERTCSWPMAETSSRRAMRGTMQLGDTAASTPTPIARRARFHMARVIAGPAPCAPTTCAGTQPVWHAHVD